MQIANVKQKQNLVSACGPNLGAYTAKPRQFLSVHLIVGFTIIWRIWRKFHFSMIFTILVASVLPNLRYQDAFFLKWWVQKWQL